MKDKEYKITESELRELLKSTIKVALNANDPIIEDTIFAFFLSKTPIQEPNKIELDKKIEYAVNREMLNLIGDIKSIVKYVLTDQSKLPKFEDIIGLLKDK